LPGITDEERTRYNQLQDNSFLEYIDEIISPNRTVFYKNYDFKIQPATDNKPYFSQFLRWESLPHLSELFGNRLPFFEIGYLIVIVTLLQITVIAFLLIILPLFKLGWKGESKFRTLLYFGGIGLGYMFMEIALIQRLMLYFGNPVYATSASISVLLIFSGIGSYLSDKFSIDRKRLLVVFAVILLLIIVYTFSLTTILQKTIALSLWLKIIVVVVMIAPLAICMGMPFPCGLSMLSQRNESLVPWAWGVNGCLSVISAVLATVVAVEMGFVWVMIFAGIGYSVPLIVNMRKSGRY